MLAVSSLVVTAGLMLHESTERSLSYRLFRISHAATGAEGGIGRRIDVWAGGPEMLALAGPKLQILSLRSTSP